MQDGLHVTIPIFVLIEISDGIIPGEICGHFQFFS